MSNYKWAENFRDLYDLALKLYRAGNRVVEDYFSADQRQFLDSIGAQPSELFDYAEDADELDFPTAVLITSVRRNYFLHIQRGQYSINKLKSADFPTRDAELRGIAWLPRLIMKAEGRIKGILPPEIMYCCAGDRKFFGRYNIHPADFLQLVVHAGENRDLIVDHLEASEGRKV